MPDFYEYGFWGENLDLCASKLSTLPVSHLPSPLVVLSMCLAWTLGPTVMSCTDLAHSIKYSGYLQSYLTCPLDKSWLHY